MEDKQDESIDKGEYKNLNLNDQLDESKENRNDNKRGHREQ